MILSNQCRAARGLLGWTQEQLAKNAGVGLSTVRDFELGSRKPISRNRDAILNAFEKAGVIFLADGDIAPGGPGVRLKS